MPCDTITTSNVQQQLKNVNHKLLKKALEAMGFTVNEKDGVLTFYGIHEATGTAHSGIYENGKFTEQVRGLSQAMHINLVKKAYSHEVIKATAMSFGWKLSQTGVDSYVAQKG